MLFGALAFVLAFGSSVSSAYADDGDVPEAAAQTDVSALSSPEGNGDADAQASVQTVQIDIADCRHPLKGDGYISSDCFWDGEKHQPTGVNYVSIDQVKLKDKYGVTLYSSTYVQFATSSYSFSCTTSSGSYVDAGTDVTATITATGTGASTIWAVGGQVRLELTGSVTEKLHIYPINICNATHGVQKGVTGSGAMGLKEQATASDPVQHFTLSYLGTKLVEGVDYKTEYFDNDSYGQAYLKISGMGNYTGTAWYRYKIELPTASFSGTTRYDTCRQVVDAELSLDSYKGVIVASGEAGRYPDALCASSLSGLLDYPIVLVNGSGSELDSNSKQALAALKKKAGGKLDIIIAGGESAVNAKIASQLGGYGTVSKRLGGATRYDTALAIYNYGTGKNGGWGKSNVIIARGDDFADSLSISPYASKAKAPIFLVPSNDWSLGDSLASIVGKYKQAVIVGGTSAVADSVYNQAKSLAGKATRLAGGTRYETSAKIAEWELGQGMGFSYVGFATGNDFPDSLASGFLQAKRNSVLLLVGGNSSYDWSSGDWNSEYSYARSLIEKQVKKSSFAGTTQVSYFGGTAALAQNIRDAVEWSFVVNSDAYDGSEWLAVCGNCHFIMMDDASPWAHLEQSLSSAGNCGNYIQGAGFDLINTAASKFGN